MGNRNVKWLTFCLVGICLFILFLTLCIARSNYERNVAIEPYEGLLVGGSFYYGKTKNNICYTNFILINPNNLKECFVINTDEVEKRLKATVIGIAMEDDVFYCLARKENEQLVVKIPGNINKMQVISKIACKSKTERTEMFFHNKNIYVGIDNEVYCINPIIGEKDLIWDNKQKNGGVYPYKQGIITSCSDDEVNVFDNGIRQKMNIPQGMKLNGICGDDLLLNNNGKVVLFNAETGFEKSILQKNFMTLETINDRTIIVMPLPSKGGGPIDLLDFYYHYEWIDLLRKEHFEIYQMCIYDIKSRNAINFPWNMTDSFILEHAWQNCKWNKDKLHNLIRQSFGNVRYELKN